VNETVASLRGGKYVEHAVSLVLYDCEFCVCPGWLKCLCRGFTPRGVVRGIIIFVVMQNFSEIGRSAVEL